MICHSTVSLFKVSEGSGRAFILLQYDREAILNSALPLARCRFDCSNSSYA